MILLEKICPVCNKKFKGKKLQTCCSRECSNKRLYKKISVKCEICGKELKRTKGNVSIGNLYESIKKNVTKTSIEVNNKIQTPNLSVSKTFENWQLHKIKE